MYIKISNLSKYFRMFKRQPGLKGAITSFFNRDYSDFYALKNIYLSNRRALEFFARKGDWHTLGYCSKVKSLDAWGEGERVAYFVYKITRK